MSDYEPLSDELLEYMQNLEMPSSHLNYANKAASEIRALRARVDALEFELEHTTDLLEENRIMVIHLEWELAESKKT